MVWKKHTYFFFLLGITCNVTYASGRRYVNMKRLRMTALVCKEFILFWLIVQFPYNFFFIPIESKLLYVWYVELWNRAELTILLVILYINVCTSSFNNL